MNGVFSPWAIACIFVFVVSSMLTVGTSLTIGDIVSPLRNVRLLLTSVITSFVLVPLAATVISLALFLDEPYRIGLILVGMTAGNEALPKAAAMVEGDSAFAVALMTMQISVSAILVPVVAVIALPEVDIAMSPLLLKLSLVVFAPLIAGLAMKKWGGRHVLNLHRVFHAVSNIFLAAVVFFILFHGYGLVVSVFGSRAILAGLLLLSSSAFIGYFLGGPSAAIRRVLCIGSCGRNVSIALLIAIQAFDDPKVAVMVVVMAVAMAAAFLPLVAILRRAG